MKVEISKVEKTISVLLLIVLFFGAIIWQQVQLIQLRNEVKFSQNFTTIVNQLNQNTTDIRALVRAVQQLQGDSNERKQ